MPLRSCSRCSSSALKRIVSVECSGVIGCLQLTHHSPPRSHQPCGNESKVIVHPSNTTSAVGAAPSLAESAWASSDPAYACRSNTGLTLEPVHQAVAQDEQPSARSLRR